MAVRVDSILDKSNELSPLSVPGSQTALLLLDYQNSLFSRISAEEGARVVATAGRLKAWAERSGALIVHGLIDVAGAPRAHFKSKQMVSWLQEQVKEDPTRAEEHPAVRPRADAKASDEVVVYRTLGVFGAMHSRGLEELLRARGVRSLVIGGIATSGCVLSTSRPAADLDYIVTVIEDACADPKPEIHDAVIKNILLASVHVCTAATWEEAWGKAHS